MAPNSLYPAFVVIDYHSPWGAHTMTLPTREWLPESSAGGKGVFDSWSHVNRDADDMIKDFANLLKVFFQPDHFLDQYTIYTMETPTSKPLPVAANSLGIEGTEASSHWSKAVMTTFSGRTDAFGIFKLVLLDAPVPNSFDKISSFDASAEANALIAEYASVSSAWSGRDNAKPGTLTQITYTMNENLRRAYNMT